MGNAFIESAKRSKRKQDGIERGDAGHGREKMVCINVMVPKDLRDRAQMHRIETGENVTQLVRRLLERELAD